MPEARATARMAVAARLLILSLMVLVVLSDEACVVLAPQGARIPRAVHGQIYLTAGQIRSQRLFAVCGGNLSCDNSRVDGRAWRLATGFYPGAGRSVFPA